MHPSLRILALITLALLVQMLAPAALAVLGVALLAPSAICYGALLGKMFRRSRWLLLTLLLIYAFGTPGEYLPWWTWHFAPTYEGLQAGLLQAVRIIVMLIGLVLLLGSTPRASMMAGIYQLLLPLRFLGLTVERFTARLWLTLHYVEEDHPSMRGNLWQTLDRLAAAEGNHADAPVRFMMPAFGWRDWGGMLVLLLALLWWFA